MLTLTREINQKVIIGDSIELVVLGIKGNQVSIGVDAPKEVAIIRTEAKKKQVSKK
jgi:carbon storage regulator